MSQRANSFQQSTSVSRSQNNPYLERVMRLVGIGISVALSIFTLFGIYGIVNQARFELSEQHSTGLTRLETALEERLDRYTTDLLSLRNDQNLLAHLNGTPNVAAATARAAEIIALHIDEYERIQFISLQGEEPTVIFGRDSVDVMQIVLGDGTPYVPRPEAANAFAIAARGINRNPILSEFYTLTDADGNLDTAVPIMLDAFIPLAIESETVMVINIQIDTRVLRNTVNLALGEVVDAQDGRRVLLLEGATKVIADSGAIGRTYLENLVGNDSNIVGDEYYENLFDLSGLLAGTTEPIANFASNTLASANVVDYSLIPNLNWRLVISDNALIFYNGSLIGIFAVVAIAIFLSIFVVQTIKRILRPVLQAVYEADTLVQTAAVGSEVVLPSSGNQSEFVSAARRISTRLNRLSADLENTTTKRNRDMQVAGRIGRETATLFDLDALATRAINLICNELGFYHAQIFLLDESGTTAVLRYSRGEAGQALIERGHQLRVGSDTVIGTVTADQRAVIVNDTSIGSRDPHAFNPLLADTRAEMGLPLLIGDTVIGALDIQSRNVNAFLEDDLPTYQLLADQLAVGIYNAQLREQTDHRIQQINTLNQQLTRDTWVQTEKSLQLQPEYGVHLQDTKLAADISIRGEVIGSIEADLPEGEDFSEGERQILQSVAERVSLALENARLFQETQLSLQETSVLYRLSRRLNESDHMEGVLEAIIDTVASDSSGGQVWLFDEILPNNRPDWVHISVDLPVMPRANHVNLIDRRMQLSQYDFTNRLTPDNISTLENINEIEELRQELRELFININAIAMVLIPLNMRGSWRGFMSIAFAEPRTFTEQEQRLYQAMIAQAGVAIENRLLLQQTEDSLARQEKLYAASRIINTSQTLPDLVYAAVATASDPSLDFWLAMMHGDMDERGWSHQVQVVAKSHGGDIESVSEIHHINVPEQSPMRRREPEILVDPGEEFEDVPAAVKWMREQGFKFVAIFPLFSNDQPLALFYIVNKHSFDLSPDDYEVYRALTGQMSTQIQNRNLLAETQFERQRLTEILQTLPVGVMVLDPLTLKPVLTNDRVEELLAKVVRFDEPFTAAAYDLFRTDTHVQYPDEDLPMYKARQSLGSVMPVDDIAIINEFGRTDLLISAAPIFDDSGNQRAIVAAFQDISTLRSMEHTMQENLRETVLLYETQRALLNADEFEALLDALITQLAMQQPGDAHIILRNEDDELVLSRSLVEPLHDLDMLQPILKDVLINIEDVHRDASLEDGTRQVLAKAGARSALVLPLAVRTRERPMGWMLMLEAEPEAFTDDQERILSSVADMTSQSIYNSYLIENTQIALQDTASLFYANEAISRATDLDELFDSIEMFIGNTMQPDVMAGFILKDGIAYEMFNHGFDASDESDFSLERLVHMPLPQEQAIYISNVESNTLSPFELEVIRSGLVNAFAAINLRVKDVPSGRLIVGYKNPHKFREADQRFLSAIADSASVVIDNQMLLEQVQTTLNETSILYQASKALIEIDEPAEIVEAIVANLVEEHITQVFIALLTTPNWDAPEAVVEVVAGWQAEGDISLQGISLSPEQFPAWKQLSHHDVLMIDDIYDEQYNLDVMEQISIESLDTRSLVILPLRVPGRAIGAIWLGSQEPHQYGERDLRIFRSFAEQTSLALEAKRLLDQTERRARQLQTSAVISQSVGQILDLEILLPQVVDLIKDQFGYDHVQIFLMDDANEWAVLEASTGDAGQKLLEIQHKLARGSNSVIGRVTEVGEPTIALDTADADVVHQPNPFLPMTRSEMALPMVVKGEIVGALDVQSNSPRAFTDEDVQVLSTLAAQIAVAIDNARLYEEAEQSAEDMAFLFEITTIAAAADNLDVALEYVARQIRAGLNSDIVAIYLQELYEDYYGNQKQVMEIAALDSEMDIALSTISSIETDDNETILGIVSETLQPHIIADVRDEARYIPISTNSYSAIVVPISSGATRIGAIVLESHRLNAYDPNDLNLIQALTGSLAAVIQNTLLVERLQETNEQLREVDRLKSQFLASMSHELRTPLNSIIGFSRVMLKGIDGPLTEMQEQDLTTIYNSGNHLLRLINDILDQAKIEANELNLKFGYFDIKPLVESVKSIAIGLLKEKPELEFHVEIAEGLPKAYADEFRSRQILLNLVTNAIKFTQQGAVTIRVYAIEGDPAPMLQLDVIDTGIGIAEQDLPTVFEQFRQVDSSLTRTVGGTGLGLPISKSLAEMQGGNLVAESEVNVGSVFSVTIPTYEGAEETLERQQAEHRATQKPVQPKSEMSSTSSGLISKEDVEEAKRKAGIGANGQSGEKEDSKLDTQEFQIEKKRQSGLSDANVTQSIPLITQKRDVILVEDDKTMVDQFRRILQREGFEVTTADFPAFAEAMIGQIRPSVVLLDVNFADGVGWEMLKNLKERDDTFDIPIVVTTMDEDSERAYRLGAHTFIQRPFLPDDLLEAVLEAEDESKRERIVIIDDQPDAIRLLTQLLEEHSDFKVYSAQSGDEGISLVARRRPDLIILDLRMPGKDGFAVLDELRGNPETAKIPVLVVTGELDLDGREQEQLVDIHVLHKTDISQEEYDLFIDNVRSFLEANHGKNQ